MTRWRVVGLALTTWVVALAVLVPGPAPAPESTPEREASAARTTTDRAELAEAVAVLAAWDVRRSAAWAAQDPAALRDLYVAGSRAGAADAALLARWSAAGWRVEGLRSQVLGVAVVRATPGRLVLRVVDRVAGGRVVATSSGEERGPLPGTTSVTRTLELREGPSGWRVAVSRPVGD